MLVWGKIRRQTSKPKVQIFEKIFQKGIDKSLKIWYNIYVERARQTRPYNKKMKGKVKKW